MAADIKKEAQFTSWGISCTCSGGTAAAGAATTTIVDKGTRLFLQGVSCGGAASTDITVVRDGSGVKIWQGAPIINATSSIVFTKSGVPVDGLQVGFAGATTGFCQIYYAS